ncbi:hypothetical protein Z043_124658, partial [Scleropages formosus]
MQCVESWKETIVLILMREDVEQHRNTQPANLDSSSNTLEQNIMTQCVRTALKIHIQMDRQHLVHLTRS